VRSPSTPEKLPELEKGLCSIPSFNFLFYVCLAFNPLNAELNPIFQLLTLLGAHPILYVSRIRVKCKSGDELERLGTE
jgi:hypothetical protein